MQDNKYKLSDYEIIDVKGDGLCGWRALLLSMLSQGFLTQPNDEAKDEAKDEKINEKLQSLYHAYKTVYAPDENNLSFDTFYNRLENLKNNYNSTGRYAKQAKTFLDRCIPALILLSINEQDDISISDVNDSYAIPIFDSVYSGESLYIEAKEQLLFQDDLFRSKIMSVARYLRDKNILDDEKLKKLKGPLLYKILSGKWNYESKNSLLIESSDKFFDEFPFPNQETKEEILAYLTNVFEASEKYNERNLTPFYIALWRKKFETSKKWTGTNFLRGDHRVRFAHFHNELGSLARSFDLTLRNLGSGFSQEHTPESIAIYQTGETPFWRWFLSWETEHYKALKPKKKINMTLKKKIRSAHL